MQIALRIYIPVLTALVLVYEKVKAEVALFIAYLPCEVRVIVSHKLQVHAGLPETKNNTFNACANN